MRKRLALFLTGSLITLVSALPSTAHSDALLRCQHLDYYLRFIEAMHVRFAKERDISTSKDQDYIREVFLENTMNLLVGLDEYTPDVLETYEEAIENTDASFEAMCITFHKIYFEHATDDDPFGPFFTEMTETEVNETLLRRITYQLDPNTRFTSAALIDEFEEERLGDIYNGPGFLIDGDRIVGIVPGSPAEHLGLQIGDVIQEVNEREYDDLYSGELYNIIEEPTTLKIQRGNSTIVVEDLEEAEDIPNPNIESYLFGRTGIGYLKIEAFDVYTDYEAKNHILRLKRAYGGPLRGLVLDLRDNPGGFVGIASEIFGLFCWESEFARYANAHGPNAVAERSSDTSPTMTAPMVILVNESSASASEMIALALKDQGRAIIVGTRTYGKGTVQHYYRLDSVSFRRDAEREGLGAPPVPHYSGGLNLTTNFFYSPNGTTPQKSGVIPDIQIEDLFPTNKTIRYAQDRAYNLEAPDFPRALVNYEPKDTFRRSALRRLKRLNLDRKYTEIEREDIQLSIGFEALCQLVHNKALIRHFGQPQHYQYPNHRFYLKTDLYDPDEKLAITINFIRVKPAESKWFSGKKEAKETIHSVSLRPQSPNITIDLSNTPVANYVEEHPNDHYIVSIRAATSRGEIRVGRYQFKTPVFYGSLVE